jgi:hypothetical protein
MPTHPAVRIARIAWLATFVVPLILAALLLGVKSAEAAPATTPLALEEDFELEDEGEFVEEECEGEDEGELEEDELVEAEDACEEGEDEGKKKRADGSAVAPEECLLRSAHARLVAYDSHNDVRLTVGYTTYEPATATIEFEAKGGKGSLHLGTVKRHLGRSGVIRLTKALAEPKMAKVDAAAHFSVRLHVAGAPGSCRRFETEQLNVKRASKSQAVWSPKKP